MNYADPSAWYLQPGPDRVDGPDVFVITPTFVFDAGKPVYLDPDDPAYLAGNEEFATIAVRPVFDALAVNVWMPKYRQVNGAWFGSTPKPMDLFWGEAGPQPATADIFAAFRHFLGQCPGRYLLFSHSQGSILNGYLLTALIPALPARQRDAMAVDYLIGWGLNDAILEHTCYPASASADDTGTIVSWNTATHSEVLGKRRATWGNQSTVAVNPITFDATEYAPASANGRSVLHYFDEPQPRVVAHLTGARLLRPSEVGGVFRGQVVEVDLDEHSFRDAAAIAGQDATNLGYTHHWDASLFAEAIQANVRRRLGVELRTPAA